MHFLIVRYIMMKYWIWAWLCNWAHSFREFRNFAKNLEFLFFEWIVNIFRNWRIYTWHHKSWWRHNQWRHKPRKKLGENTAIIAERFLIMNELKGVSRKTVTEKFDERLWWHRFSKHPLYILYRSDCLRIGRSVLSFPLSASDWLSSSSKSKSTLGRSLRQNVFERCWRDVEDIDLKKWLIIYDSWFDTCSMNHTWMVERNSQPLVLNSNMWSKNLINSGLKFLLFPFYQL